MAQLGVPGSRFTKTPNAILDRTARAGATLPARHRSIVDLLLRELYGWHRAALAISQALIAERLGVSPRTVREALADLERWRVIRRHGAGRGRVAVFEFLDPRGWRITKTAGAIRAAERRREKRGAQPLLPFDDVAQVLEIPTSVSVRTRDRRGDIPRGRISSHLQERKKTKASAERGTGGRMRSALTRSGDRMPNDPPAQATAEERAQIRRTRAARLRVRRLGLGDPFDLELLERVGAALSDAELDDEIARRTAAEDEERDARASDRQAEALRHEGRR